MSNNNDIGNNLRYRYNHTVDSNNKETQNSHLMKNIDDNNLRYNRIVDSNNTKIKKTDISHLKPSNETRNIGGYYANRQIDITFPNFNNNDKNEVLRITLETQENIIIKAKNSYSPNKVQKLKKFFQSLQNFIIHLPKKFNNYLVSIAYFFTVSGIMSELKPSKLIINGVSNTGGKLLSPLVSDTSKESTNEKSQNEVLSLEEDQTLPQDDEMLSTQPQNDEVLSDNNQPQMSRKELLKMFNEGVESTPELDDIFSLLDNPNFATETNYLPIPTSSRTELQRVELNISENSKKSEPNHGNMSIIMIKGN